MKDEAQCLESNKKHKTRGTYFPSQGEQNPPKPFTSQEGGLFTPLEKFQERRNSYSERDFL